MSTQSPDLPPTPIIAAMQKAWGQPLQPAGCARCQQAFLVTAERLGQRCPYCARDVLASQPAFVRSEPPELLLRFQVTREALRPILQKFIAPLWFKPRELNVNTLWQRTHVVYWPLWLVDSDVNGAWRAEVGFDYQVKSTQERYNAQGWQSQEIIETRVRWEPRIGQLARHYANVAVSALSVQPQLERWVGRYPIAQASAHDLAQLTDSAISVQVPDLQPINAWPQAQDQLRERAAAECSHATGAQHIRNFAISANYQALRWTQLLLPLYVTYYADDSGQIHPLYINGHSGAIGGQRFASARRGAGWAVFTGLCAFGAFVIGLGCLLLASRVALLGLLGVVGVLGSFVLGLIALVMLLWPWWWNHQEQQR